MSIRCILLPYDISRYPSWGAIITCAVCDAATAAA